MIEDNMVTGNANADDSAAEDQGVSQTFTQEDIDRIVKERLDRERKKFSKQFEGIDVERYRELTAKEEQTRLEQEKKNGNFEKVLQETVSKKDQTIQQLQQQIHSIKVDGSLLNAASANRAVNPQQVVRLLKDQIRLGETGDVEILDEAGEARYSDKGKLMTVDDLVAEFLTANPHFVGAGPSGSGATGAVAKSTGKNLGNIDITKLNMALESDRAIYKELMKSRSR
jgi:hypothetical protein